MRVLDGSEVIAGHQRVYGKGEQIENPAHIEALSAPSVPYAITVVRTYGEQTTKMHREAYDNRIQDINQCELGFDDDIPFLHPGASTGCTSCEVAITACRYFLAAANNCGFTPSTTGCLTD